MNKDFKSSRGEWWWSRRTTVILILIAVCQLIFVTVCEWYAFYDASPSDLQVNPSLNLCFNSDYAAELMQGQLIAQQGGWMFANGWLPSTEIRVLHVQLITSLLFRFMSDYHLVGVVTSVIVALLVMASSYYLVRVIGSHRNTALLSCILMLIPCFPLYQCGVRFLFYGFFVICGFLLTGLYFSVRFHIHKGIRAYIDYTCILLLSFGCGACGQRYLLLVLAPMICVEGISLLKRKHSNISLKNSLSFSGKPIVLMSICMVIGVIVYDYCIIPTYYIHPVVHNTLPLASSQAISSSFSFLPLRLIEIWGANDLMLRTFSFIALAGIIIGMIALVFYYAIFRYRVKDTEVQRAFSEFVFAQSVLNILVLLFVNIESNIGALPLRYIALGMMTIIPYLAVVFGDMAGRVDRFAIRRTILASLIVLLVLGDTMDSTYTKTAVNSPNLRVGYISYLEDKGFTIGEATFWNADATTACTNGLVQVIPILTAENQELFYWLMDDSLTNREPQFLLMSEDEYQQYIDTNTSIENSIVYDDGSYVIADLR